MDKTIRNNQWMLCIVVTKSMTEMVWHTVTYYTFHNQTEKFSELLMHKYYQLPISIEISCFRYNFYKLHLKNNIVKWKCDKLFCIFPENPANCSLLLWCIKRCWIKIESEVITQDYSHNYPKMYVRKVCHSWIMSCKYNVTSFDVAVMKAICLWHCSRILEDKIFFFHRF